MPEAGLRTARIEITGGNQAEVLPEGRKSSREPLRDMRLLHGQPPLGGVAETVPRSRHYGRNRPYLFLKPRKRGRCKRPNQACVEITRLKNLEGVRRRRLHFKERIQRVVFRLKIRLCYFV